MYDRLDPAVIERAAEVAVNYLDAARFCRNGNNERLAGAVLRSPRKTESSRLDALYAR